MKIDVLNRFSRLVQITAEIDCDDTETVSVKMGMAVRWAIKNDANLSDADLSGADLSDADLSDADLSGADLSDADLSDAYLRGANLSGANLSDADLIHCGNRSDGYDFFAHVRNGKIWIKAGCRYFTIADAKAHWKRTRPDTQLGAESMQLLKNANRLVKIRGLMENPQ